MFLLLRTIRLSRLRRARKEAPAVLSVLTVLADAGRLDLAVDLGRARLLYRPDDAEARLLVTDFILRSGDPKLALSVLSGMPACLSPETNVKRLEMQRRVEEAETRA